MNNQHFIPSDEKKADRERTAREEENDFATLPAQTVALSPLTRGSRAVGGEVGLEPSLGSLALHHEEPYRSVQVASRRQYQVDNQFEPPAVKMAPLEAYHEEVIVFTDDEPPCPKFGYIEMHNHVRSDKKPTLLLESAYGCLKRLQVDCTMQPQKFKISADAYHAGSKLSFVVRVYTHDDSCPNPRKAKGKYILEMQRRSGDSVRFAELYRSLVTHLEENDMLSETVFTSQSSPPVPVHAAPFDIDVTCAGETIKCLKQMAASSYLDVKTEAFCCLAHFSQEPSLLDVLMEEGALELFVSVLTDSNENLRRCGVTGLANLVFEREPKCRELVSRGIVRDVIDSLVKSIHEQKSTPQITREGARLLRNVGLMVGTDMLPQDRASAVELVNLLTSSPDEFVRVQAASLREVLLV